MASAGYSTMGRGSCCRLWLTLLRGLRAASTAQDASCQFRVPKGMESAAHTGLGLCQDLFCSYRDDHVVFVSQSTYLIYYICWLKYVEPSCVSWIQFAYIKPASVNIGDFCVCVFQGYWPEVFFLCGALSGLGSRPILTSLEFGSIPSFSMSLNNLRSIGYGTSLKFWFYYESI